MGALLLIAAMMFGKANHAATPQQAALIALHGHPAVVRTNIAGRFATVLTSGGIMESSIVDSAILVERFSFGWQAVDIINFRCRLLSHPISTSDLQKLMYGMPSPKYESHCGPASDVGPKADVEAVRLLMQGPLVPTVAVEGDYALGEWYGAGGGQSLFARRNGTWHLIGHGGGAMDNEIVRAFGVPPHESRVLLPGPNCPPSPNPR